jgi:hypothetical protein
MEVTPQARMPHEVFYVLYFPTSSTVQHPSWRVAQGLFARLIVLKFIFGL